MRPINIWTAFCRIEETFGNTMLLKLRRSRDDDDKARERNRE